MTPPQSGLRSIVADRRRLALIVIALTLLIVSVTLALMGRNWVCS